MAASDAARRIGETSLSAGPWAFFHDSMKARESGMHTLVIFRDGFDVADGDGTQ